MREKADVPPEGSARCRNAAIGFTYPKGTMLAMNRIKELYFYNYRCELEGERLAARCVSRATQKVTPISKAISPVSA